ncbi:nitroreductase family protein [Intestinibacter sp.]
MNEILNIMKKRRSIRKFNEDKVSNEDLNLIIEAGRWAPTAGNFQTVHFAVLKNKEVQSKLRELVQSAFAAMEMRDDLYISIQHSIKQSQKGNYAYDYNAPILIIVSNLKSNPNAIADSACSIQNMMLEATSLGIGSCWINQLHWLEENKSIRLFLEEYGIGKDETICGAVALGHYDRELAMKERTGMKVNFID